MGEAAEKNEGTPIPGETEEKARRMGWVAEEEFRGDKDRWVSAERFVERGENELPIMRERMKKMDGTIVSLRGNITTMKKTFSEFQDFQKDAETRAYNRALKDLVAKQRVTVEENDTKGFDAIEKEKESLAENRPAAPAPAPASNPEDEKIFNEWLGTNAWFDDNIEMQQYAVNVGHFIEDNKGLTGRKLYDEIGKEVRNRFPAEFENKNRQSPTAVIDGDTEVLPPKGKRTFSDLPADAKAACDKFVKTIPGFTREGYLKDYEWE